MKPKIFIGSSVEGLSVAYSIQQNLTHDADVTVWDQGVFELSKTSIESLMDVLGKSDFGVFVFSPDDISVIRKEEKNVVRDNVIFEFGLFVGKLNRERVFFVSPSGVDFHLPTDLLGVTPGKYDPNRADKSLQAATGPVCHQIRQQIKKLGTITTSEDTAKEPEEESKSANSEYKWVDPFIEKNYEKAIKILEEQIKNEKDKDKLIEQRIWLCYCHFKTNEKSGIIMLDDILKENIKDIFCHREIARIYFWEEYYDKSIKILENAISIFGNNDSLIKILADCIKKTKGEESALQFLEEKSDKNSIDLTLEQIYIYNERKDYKKSREIIHKIYLEYPNNELLRYQYARIAMELDLNEIALYFLNALVKDFPKNSTYWGYLSNCCVAMDFYDLAMVAAKKANEINGQKQEWIVSNIGNMFKNKGFYSEAIDYLEKGILLNKESSYAHDRLSTSIKLRDEETAKINEKESEGRKLVREFKVE